MSGAVERNIAKSNGNLVLTFFAGWDQNKHITRSFDDRYDYNDHGDKIARSNYNKLDRDGYSKHMIVACVSNNGATKKLTWSLVTSRMFNL